jgi:hypothetical protein
MYSQENTKGFTLNDYLTQRNKKFFRGHSKTVHPLYEKEVKNAITSITNFLNITILKKAYLMRQKKLYSLTAEKCFKKNSNNYTFSEAETCRDILFERDPILTNIDDFRKEVEVRIQDQYEKAVKTDLKSFDEEKHESNHRAFLIRLHLVDRYYFYLLAQNLFANNE